MGSGTYPWDNSGISHGFFSSLNIPTMKEVLYTLESKFKRISKVLWIILAANLAAALLKIFFGTLIKSTSMTADGFHSLTDSSSNVIGLIGIKYASKPVDEDHPYGHKKFETITSLVIAGMLAFMAGKIIIGAIERLYNPVIPEITISSLTVLFFTLALNFTVAKLEYLQGKKLGSDILISDSIHTRSDVFISIGVLAALIGIKLGLPAIVDPIVSLAVSIFIIHSAYGIFSSSSGILLDKAVVDPDRIRHIVMDFCQVRECHKIRSRGREDDIHVDMHILTEPDLSVEQSHKLNHDIERKLRQEFKKNIQVISHIEPYYESKRAN